MTPHASGGGLSDVAIRRPTFTAMIMVALLVLGAFGLRRLNIDQFPRVDIPVIAVQAIYPGASPETMEREVTSRLEEAFNPLQGVEKIQSMSLESVSQVVVQFELGRNVDQAAQDIRGKVDIVRRSLPANMQPPIVQKFDPSDTPIVSLALSADQMPIVRLTQLANEVVRRRIEAVPGVGNVQVTGGLQRQVRVFLLPDRMQAVGISVNEVIGALQRQNLEVPAGRVESGITERLVRVTGRITDIQQFGRLIIAARGGYPVRLGQVARVEDATEDERSVALVNGQRAISLDALKAGGANTVAVADGINAAVAELRSALPEGASLRVIRDNSIAIRQSVRSVLEELVLGAILTIVIVMLFLNDWKATAITSLALPVSVISSFILMNALGFTLNLLTLMGLSLSIGILIDDAIVVAENVVRHREMGKDQFTAASEGTREIFLAVMATTFTIVAVFVPVAFMRGVVGRFFFEFGLTVAWAVLVSLFVSFTLTPMLAAHWGVSPHDPARNTGNPLTRAIGLFNRGFNRVTSGYRNIIVWALRFRLITVGIAVAALLGAFALFPYIGGGFMPETDKGEFSVQFQTPEGSSLRYTRGKTDEIVAALATLPGLSFTYTTVGAGVTGSVTSGNVFVKLVPERERKQSQNELMVMARNLVSPIAGTEITVLGGSSGSAPIQLQISGPDVLELQRLANAAIVEVRKIPGVVDVKSSMGEPRPELRIDINRDVAATMGLDISQIASTIQPILAGQTATTWQDPEGQVRQVVVQVAPEQRTSVEDVEQLPILTGLTTKTGAPVTVPLGAVAKTQAGVAAAQITRVALKRVVSISATTLPSTSVAEASTAVRAALNKITLPPGYSPDLGGETAQLDQTTGYVLEAIMMAVILIFLILASQFESVLQPIAIMLSLPLSLIGVLLALLLTHDTLNMMSMIGVMMLLGLVTKNAILLVDNANHRMALGTPRHTALVESGEARLRPIMMTTIAMIVGMLPIATALGEGGAFRAPMARAVIGGLITSTLLTLVVVPVAFTYFDDFGGWITGRNRKAAVRGTHEPLTAAEGLARRESLHG